jgi:hypothetical protein
MPTRLQDDDDWTGTPPEGRYTADRADPGHWAKQWRMQGLAFGGLLILIIVVLLLAVL